MKGSVAWARLLRLEDEEARRFNELIGAVAEKIVALQHELALAQFLLRALKVEVNAQALEKLGHGVRVRVVLL